MRDAERAFSLKDQSLSVSKGVILCLSSIFSLKQLLRNEGESKTRGERKKGNSIGRGGSIENANPAGAFFPSSTFPCVLSSHAEHRA